MSDLKKSLSLLALVVVCASCLVAPSTADASSRQKTIIQDDGMLHGDPAQALLTLEKMSEIGVDIVKITAVWRDHAPSKESDTIPALDLADPANYDWAHMDFLVTQAEARGLTPWILVAIPAPNWASSRLTETKRPGLYKPDPKQFGLFTEAISRHFSGVRYWSVMNEPNFQSWFWPQIGSGKVSLSAVHYRKMYIEAREGFERSGSSGDEIMFGELAPRALQPSKGAQATQPVRFLRDLFCLDDKLAPLKGSAAKARECTGKYKTIKATGFAHHPYTPPTGPFVKPTFSDDAPIAALKRLYRVLDKAYSLGRLSQKRIPLWNTEFGFQSNPPDIYWTPIARVPQYMNASEFLSYRDSRVRSFAQYQLRDEPLGSGSSLQYSGFQSGLFFSDGTPKPAPLAGFQLPLVVNKTKSSNRVTIWGGARKLAPTAQDIALQVRDESGVFQTVKTISLPAGTRYFTTSYAAKNAKQKTYRIVAGSLVGVSTPVTKPLSALSK